MSDQSLTEQSKRRMSVYERFIQELEALTIKADKPAVAVVGELTRAVKRAQMVVDGELRPVGQRPDRPGEGKEYGYRLDAKAWNVAPELLWEYMSVMRMRAIAGARDPKLSQRVCRVIVDEVEQVLLGHDPAGPIKAAVEQAQAGLLEAEDD